MKLSDFGLAEAAPPGADDLLPGSAGTHRATALRVRVWVGGATARALTADPAGSGASRAKGLGPAGSPLHMAPEAFQGRAAFASDIW